MLAVKINDALEILSEPFEVDNQSVYLEYKEGEVFEWRKIGFGFLKNKKVIFMQFYRIKDRVRNG